MYSATTVTNQEDVLETVPVLTHPEAVVRLSRAVAAMAALDREIEHCTDPLAESCLLALRVEHQVTYLETLYGWEHESSAAAVIQ
jgi:hypothetical protein